MCTCLYFNFFVALFALATAVAGFAAAATLCSTAALRAAITFRTAVALFGFLVHMYVLLAHILGGKDSISKRKTRDKADNVPGLHERVGSFKTSLVKERGRRRSRLDSILGEQ